MRFIRFAATSALLLQLPCLVMAADVTVDMLRSSTNNSNACANGLKSATTGADPTKFSSKLRQTMLSGTGVDQLAADERAFLSALQAAAATCDAGHNAHRGLMTELAAMLEKGNPPSADFKAEFDKTEAAFKTANAVMADVSKVPVFASVLHKSSSKK